MPPSTAMTSRRPSASIPTATSMPTFPTYPPRERLRYAPSMNTYGYSYPNGRLRHSSISSYTLLKLVAQCLRGHAPTHSNWPVSSTCLVDKPAGYMSVDDSSTLCSRRRYRSITADSKTAPFGFGAFGSSLLALAVRLHS